MESETDAVGGPVMPANDAAVMPANDAAVVPADNAAAVTAIRHRHLALDRRLGDLVEALAAAAADQDDVGVEAAALFGWCRSDLLPLVGAEESALYVPGRGRPATDLLVRSLQDRGHRMRDAADELDSVDDPLPAISAAARVAGYFTAHIADVGGLLLDALDAAGVDLAAIVASRPELVGMPARPRLTVTPVPRTTDTVDGPAGERITGREDVDVRPLPHHGRHTIVFGKLQQLTGAGEIVIINDHDPKPLRFQAEALWPGRFAWTYLEEGPVQWRVRVCLAGD